MLNRRSALQWLGLGVNAAAAGSTRAAAKPVTFEHGVASGDPLSDRVIIWTRVTTNGEASAAPVQWVVSDRADFSTPVAKGTASAAPDRDFTVKIDVTGLKPGTDYWYRFTSGGAASPIGRTRTLAKAGADDEVVLAVVSCSLHPAGYFNAYDAIARLDKLDAVVHLGDYIYEYGGAVDDFGMETGRKLGRIPQPPHEIRTLQDYRQRHAQYKSDPLLQAAHARAPWICVWDDHETANDAWLHGAENHTPATEGDWEGRKAQALRAYYEWMPLREPAAGGLASAINRSFRFGDVAELFMVETRLTARSQQLDYGHMPMRSVDGREVPDFEAFARLRNAPDRQLLGPAQEAWLAQGLKASRQSGCTWQLLGNQVVMGQVKGPDLKAALPPADFAAMLGNLPERLRPRIEAMAALFAQGVPFNLDAWDGYPAARERVYRMIRAAQANAVVLAGDSHAFWANELHDANGDRVAVEFGTTGVTSPGWGDFLPNQDLGAIMADQNKDVVYSHQSAKGFVRLTLTREAARGELIAVSTITEPTYRTSTLKSYRTPARFGAGFSEG